MTMQEPHTASDLDTLALPTADQDNTLHMRLLRYAKKMRGRYENHAAELAFEAAMAVKKEETMAQDWVREAAWRIVQDERFNIHGPKGITQTTISEWIAALIYASMPEQRWEREAPQDIVKILDELEDLSRSLQVPAAEYVPVIPEAWERIQLIQAHIMCIDPASLLPQATTAQPRPGLSDPRIPLHPCCGYPTEGIHAGHAKSCPAHSDRLTKDTDHG